MPASLQAEAPRMEAQAITSTTPDCPRGHQSCARTRSCQISTWQKRITPPWRPVHHAARLRLPPASTAASRKPPCRKLRGRRSSTSRPTPKPPAAPRRRAPLVLLPLRAARSRRNRRRGQLRTDAATALAHRSAATRCLGPSHALREKMPHRHLPWGAHGFTGGLSDGGNVGGGW
jgi:hypothetical protein